MRYAILLAFIMTAVPGGGANAQYSASVGGSNAGDGPWNLTCSGDAVLVGIEVKYGDTGAGTTRGICREVGWDGVWSGTSGSTDWSWNDTPSQRVQQTNRNCASGQVVAGFAGATSGPNIHRLQLACADIEGASPGGTGTDTRWAGHSGGSESSLLYCPAGEVARGFQVRARSILHYYRLICGDLPPVAEPTSVVNVNGFEAYDYARRNGFNFLARNDDSNSLDPTCALYVERNQLFLETTPISGAKTCRFELFENGRLRNGWVIRRMELDHQNNTCARDTRVTGPDSATDPAVHVFVERRPRDSNLCIVRLRSVRLEGPIDSDWRRAFR